MTCLQPDYGTEISCMTFREVGCPGFRQCVGMWKIRYKISMIFTKITFLWKISMKFFAYLELF